MHYWWSWSVQEVDRSRCTAYMVETYLINITHTTRVRLVRQVLSLTSILYVKHHLRYPLEALWDSVRDVIEQVISQRLTIRHRLRHKPSRINLDIHTRQIRV